MNTIRKQAISTLETSKQLQWTHVACKEASRLDQITQPTINEPKLSANKISVNEFVATKEGFSIFDYGRNRLGNK